MKIWFLVCIFLALFLPFSTKAADVGVIIEGPPEYYGEVDVQAVPDPWLVYEEPVVIEQTAETAKTPPVYLYVPGDHHRRWFKHCHDYNACSVPVFFVKKSWYREVYVPKYYGDRPTGRPVIILDGRHRYRSGY